MTSLPLQYITDTNGKNIAVVLPIEFWNSIFPQDDTAKILSSKKMKMRILESIKRNEGYSLEAVHAKLGI
jgi:hypothetical protein